MKSQYTEEYIKFRDNSYCWKYMDKYSLLKHLKPILCSSSKVLDAGCGTGVGVEFLLDLGVRPENITGVDLSSELIKVAKTRSPKSTFIVSDLIKVPLKHNSYDVIISNMVFEDLSPSNWLILVGLMSKWLCKKGHLIFNVAHPLRGDTSREIYFSTKPRKGKTPWGTEIEIYPKTFSLYTNTLIRAGFKLDAIEENIPVIQGKKADLESYKKYSSIPTRLTVSAIKE